MLISFLSLLIGSLGALVQLKIKRFLGYSTISHIGYMLLPLLSTDYTHIIPTIFLYLLNYILIMIQILTILIVVFSITGNFIAGKLKGMRFTVYNKSMV
jgi:NADH-quinone oxidoreductase subunit N